MPLTDTHIRSLKPDVKPRKYFDGGGLFLFVPANGSKLWRMAYRFDGKSKLLSFGEYPTVSLKDARERREEAKRMLSRGIDPSDYKRQIRQARAIAERDSFQNIAREWHETRMAEFSEKHQGTVMYRLETYIFPAIGKTHIAKLETRDVMEVVKPLEQRGNYETSRRVLQIISQVFRYAVITGRAKHNVAADLRGALRPRKTVHRAAVLEPEKVGQLLRDIGAYEGYFPLVCALKLAPLVFTRPTELRAAQWKEFDLEAGEWRIPAERMKMRRQHLVPLSRQAMSILRELQKYSGEGKFLFPSIRTEARPIQAEPRRKSWPITHILSKRTLPRHCSTPRGWRKNANILWKKHEAFAGVNFLRVNGVEAIHWLECGASNAPDREIMAYARENGYIVFTHDLDFSSLLANSKDSKPSVIQLRANDTSPEATGKVILATLRQMSSELETGALLTIDPKRSRIRLLPL